jgi:hypothetical protein
MMNVTMMGFLSVLIEEGWDPHPLALFSFTHVNVFLFIVYLVEGPGTSVELHILTTHLQRGSREVVCTQEWVELPRWRKRSQTRRRAALSSLHWRRGAIWGTALLEQVVLERIAGGRGSRGDAKFAIQGGGMVVDGARTDHQLLGDLGIGPALSEQAQDLHLPGGQARGISDRLVRWCTPW